uniref:Platelet-derived growth factor receptor-like protein n=1 Tax=Knipowitschia caucasica TaxID=637954 RepID=A0AAV2MJ84_KNICA
MAHCQEAQKIQPGKKAKIKNVKSTKPKAAAARVASAQSLLTQVVRKGRFQRVGETITVRTGDTLELRCRGKPVQWTVPSYLEEDHEGRLKTVEHEKYGVLTLVNTTGADTGEFTCFPLFCEDTDCRREYSKAAKVFVFFPDPQELFVPSSDYYEVVQLRTNWPTVLPCQVTSPEAKVTLHREYPPSEVPVDGSEISFDVKKGFTIHRPRPHHAGEVYCVASLGNLRQSSIKYMLIYVNYPRAVPAPVIQASSSSLTAGDNLRVTCSVMGEQDVAIDITWDYPGQQIGRPQYTQDSVTPAGANTQQSQSVLLVDEVRDVDQGTYTCTAHNLQGSKSASTTVKVTPKASPKPKAKKP